MTNEKIDKVHGFLLEHGIDYKTHYHPPIPTIEMALEYWKEIDSTHCKNLFFRNHKGNRHYLVVFECHKELGIHTLEKSLKQGKLSFASQERMERCLGLLPGSVSPFGLINDMDLTDLDGKPTEGVSSKELFENGHRVKLFLDKDLKRSEKISFHPCDNTASTVISNSGFMKFLKIWGGEYEWIDIQEEKKLSIIIPAYNMGNYIDECIDSCCRQDIPSSKYEIIIVNDGSTDSTEDKALKWAETKDNIKVISQENKGLSIARNTGIQSASGQYIMFVDCDDYIKHNSLEKIVNDCISKKLDMLRFCAANIIDGKEYKRFSFTDEETIEGKELLKKNFQVCAPFAIYRKDFLQANKLEFYPGIYHEDNLFTPQAYYYASRVASINDTIYYVRQTPESITRTPNPKRGYDLLKVIEMLDSFAQNKVEKDYQPYIYKQIADCVNGTIKLLNSLSDEDADKLKEALLKDRGIFRHMLKSHKLTHRIEGRMLCSFPKKMKSIYNILNIKHR